MLLFGRKAHSFFVSKHSLFIFILFFHIVLWQNIPY
nr:MAG TPA: hypothetical protein [Caudoviricetes sp.]